MYRKLLAYVEIKQDCHNEINGRKRYMEEMSKKLQGIYDISVKNILREASLLELKHTTPKKSLRC